MYGQIIEAAGTLTFKIVMLLVVFLGGLVLGLKLSENRWEAKWDKREAAWSAASLEAERAVRLREVELQVAADAARKDADAATADTVKLKGEIDALNRSVARLRIDRDRLHDDLVNYASGVPSADTLSACVARARGLADLLADGAGVVAGCGDLVRRGAELAGESAAAADLRRAKLRACLSGWPR